MCMGLVHWVKALLLPQVLTLLQVNECWLYYKSMFSSPSNQRNVWDYSKVKCWTYGKAC